MVQNVQNVQTSPVQNSSSTISSKIQRPKSAPRAGRWAPNPRPWHRSWCETSQPSRCRGCGDGVCVMFFVGWDLLGWDVFHGAFFDLICLRGSLIWMCLTCLTCLFKKKNPRCDINSPKDWRNWTIDDYPFRKTYVMISLSY